MIEVLTQSSCHSTKICLNRLGYFFVVGLKLLGNLGDRANVDLTLKHTKVRDSAPAVRLALNRNCHCSLITELYFSGASDVIQPSHQLL